MAKNTISVYTMLEYCQYVKQYIETYQTFEFDVLIYGNKKDELKRIIDDVKMEESMFILVIFDLMGGVTRVLQGNAPGTPFIDWIGGNGESFTKDYFINTMQAVWPDL